MPHAPMTTPMMARLAAAAVILLLACLPATAQQTGEQALPFGAPGQTIRILPTERLFTVENIVYSDGRTTVTYGDLEVTADRMVIDLVVSEVQLEGNVVFVKDDDTIRASAGYYNFRRQEGVVFDAEGEYGGLFFRTISDEDAEGASFRRLNEDQAIFRGASYTACGFPVPHYYVKASEIVVVLDERIFMKNAVLVVQEIPVLYWPLFTTRLGEASPWSVELGFQSRYGGYVRVGYQYKYETLTPDWDDPTKYRQRSYGNIALRSDLFTGGAVGAGMNWRYNHDFQRHIGELDIYGIRDSVRQIDSGPGRDEGSEGSHTRYIYRHRHNSIYGKTILQLNADWMSDPDVYDDTQDPFTRQDRRGFVPERRLRAAVTYVERDWVARLSGEIKERITLSRYQDFTEPFADDLLFDPDPDFTTRNDRTTDGVSSRRYGRVSQKLEGRVATRMLPVLNLPLYVRGEANVFRNLDAGFNEKTREDDATFYGADFYGSATNRMRLDRNGRFTWINTVGAGVGYYHRDTDRLVPKNGPATIDSLRIQDDETIFLGAGGRRLDYGNVNPLFLWADYTSRLSARFTDSLSGWLQYSYRNGTKDGVGTFYEFAGRREAFEDIYNFPIEQHWVEAFLDYALMYPNVRAFVGAGRNLQSTSDIAAGEQRWYATTGGAWVSDSGEYSVDGRLTIDGRQIRDRRDPNDYERRNLSGALVARYIPRHGRYWGSLAVEGSKPLRKDPITAANRLRARFDENDTDISITPTIGREFGPKYDVEVFAEYNTRIGTLREAGVTIIRDLHDADLSLFTGIVNNTRRDRDRDDDTDRDYLDTETEFEFRVGLKFKQPSEEGRLGAVSITTMRDRERQASFVN